MEVAAGVVAAEQAISTTIEGGLAAGYAIARQTGKCSATLTRFVTAPKDQESPDSLARFSHTINAVEGDLYIFSGLVSETKLAGNEMHIFRLSNNNASDIQYKVAPALGSEDSVVPAARFGHAACAIDGQLFMFGGCLSTEMRQPSNEKGVVWVFDPRTFQWTRLSPSNERYPARYHHGAAAHGRKLVIYGGYAGDGNSIQNDAWLFDIDSQVWIELPPMKGAETGIYASPSIAVANDRLYVVFGTTNLDSEIRVLDLNSTSKANAWSNVVFPTNPLTTGPRPRKGAGLQSITTGMGRTYLLLMLGERDETGIETENKAQEYWSGFWTLQLPSASNTPASLKDAIREKIGMDTEEARWSEVQIVTPEESENAGKSHPGPRGHFACTLLESNKVALWGGVNAGGEAEADGWIIELKTI